MPKAVKCQYKYKCGKLIRGDKWNGHCKSDHGFKLRRGEEIKRTVVAIKEGDGGWRQFQKARPRNSRPYELTASLFEVSKAYSR